jgi:hypothetical protein
MWQAGIARTVITPEEPLWLAGYGSRRPSEGKRHDLWAKALALEDRNGRRAVLVTSDLVGLSQAMVERLVAASAERYGLERSQLLLTYSHNHCAPVTTDVLPDYYLLAPEEWKRVDAYSRHLESRLLHAIGEALSRLAPAQLSVGESETPFAVNRRNNREAEVPRLLAEGEALQGPVDHSVPVLAVHSPEGELLTAVFGYACHPTTLSDNQWCGDYPGYAQLEVEERHPGAAALFWNGCGGDQNPLPRRSVALCDQYGRMLADAVEDALEKPRSPLAPDLRTAFQSVTLDFYRRPTPEELERDAQSGNAVRSRWAKRMRSLLDAGAPIPKNCAYGVQVWRLGGEQLWIALGGEAVVDYALRFKGEYGPRTWIAGYAHEMVGYVPSRRVWNEGGYEAEFNYEYGWLAYRWTADTEERIAAAVEGLVRQTGIPAPDGG